MKSTATHLWCAAFAVCACAAAANGAPFWTAICRGEVDANFRQIIGETGAFNTANDDGTYVTWPVRQVYYKADTLLCSAVDGSASVAQVCADNPHQTIILKLRDPKQPKGALKSQVYCKALVKIHD